MGYDLKGEVSYCLCYCGRNLKMSCHQEEGAIVEHVTDFEMSAMNRHIALNAAHDLFAATPLPLPSRLSF